MNKKFVFTILLLTITSFIYSQQLNLSETLDYINQSIEKNYNLNLSSEGILELTSTTSINYSYKVHISDVSLPSDLDHNFYDKKPYRILLWCKGSRTDPFGTNWVVPCVLKLDKNHEIVDEDSYMSLYTERGDGYSTRKLFNAVKYLFSLAQESGIYDKKNNIDNDPFAPNNFSNSDNKIISTTNSGSIQLQNRNGIYYLPVKIGSFNRDFILDSGASEVLISENLENELINKGVIKKESYLSSGLYQIADGSIVECRRLILPSITIGGFIIEDVISSVGVGNAPLLIGKNVLDKFQNWKIDNLSQTLILEK